MGIRRKTGELYGVFGVWYDKKGYACISLAGKDIKLHRYIWEQKNGAIPVGYQLHHIDWNKKNYNIKNLLLVIQSDHFKIHAGWVKKNDRWIAKPCNGCKQILPIDNFYLRKGFTPTALCKKCHCKKTKEWGLRNPAKIKEIHRRWYEKQK